MRRLISKPFVTNFGYEFNGFRYQLYRSGVTPADGLELLQEDETDPALRETCRAAAEGMRDGLPLTDALRETGAFPAYLCDTVALADETGKLEESLSGLQRYYERRIRMRDEIRAALTVPLALLVVMAAVVVLLVTQVLPVFEQWASGWADLRRP